MRFLHLPAECDENVKAEVHLLDALGLIHKSRRTSQGHGDALLLHMPAECDENVREEFHLLYAYTLGLIHKSRRALQGGLGE